MSKNKQDIIKTLKQLGKFLKDTIFLGVHSRANQLLNKYNNLMNSLQGYSNKDVNKFVEEYHDDLKTFGIGKGKSMPSVMSSIIKRYSRNNSQDKIHQLSRMKKHYQMDKKLINKYPNDWMCTNKTFNGGFHLINMLDLKTFLEENYYDMDINMILDQLNNIKFNFNIYDAKDYDNKLTYIWDCGSNLASNRYISNFSLYLKFISIITMAQNHRSTPSSLFALAHVYAMAIGMRTNNYQFNNALDLPFHDLFNKDAVIKASKDLHVQIDLSSSHNGQFVVTNLTTHDSKDITFTDIEKIIIRFSALIYVFNSLQ